MKFVNYMTISFPSRSANEGFARSAVASFAAQMDPTLEELGEIFIWGGRKHQVNHFSIELPFQIG